MEEDFDFFIKSEDYSDFDLLYKISRNNKIKYRYDRSYYIVEYFLTFNILGKKYSKNDFQYFRNIYYEKYKEIQEKKIIIEQLIKIEMSDNSNYSSPYSTNDENEIDDNIIENEENNLMYDYKKKKKYLVYKKSNKILTPPIFVKNKKYFSDSNENSENEIEEYDTCNEIIDNNSSDEEGYLSE
jgi:hypothetical protein